MAGFTEGAKGVYRAKKPTSSPLWQCINNHFDDFLLAHSDLAEPVRYIKNSTNHVEVLT